MEQYRVMDRGRGEFIPTQRNPAQTQANPRAVRHLNKTAQDHMPKAMRPRVIEAQRRTEKMKNA